MNKRKTQGKGDNTYNTVSCSKSLWQLFIIACREKATNASEVIRTVIIEELKNSGYDISEWENSNGVYSENTIKNKKEGELPAKMGADNQPSAPTLIQ